MTNEHDVLNNIHSDFGKLEPLEEELFESYKKAVESGNRDAIEDYTDKWLERPEDLDELVRSKKSAIRLYVAEVGRGKDLAKLVDDPDPWVRRNQKVQAYQKLQGYHLTEKQLQQIVVML